MTRTRTRRTLSLLALVGLAMTVAACRNPRPTPSADTVPIIFVHGFYGSGDQYRAMAQYFASNGYQAERIKAFDHNSVDSAPNAAQNRLAELDAFVDATLQQFRVPKVHLVGHSMGTAIVSQYLGDQAHRDKVAKYVLVDGVGCGSTGIPCLRVAAASLKAPTGAAQTHVESAVSAESFALQYQHFLGRAPATTAVVPETGATIRLAGRVQELTVNAPVTGTTVAFWPVDPATGARTTGSPAARATTGADGFFPATSVPRGPRYEIEIPRPDQDTFHAYYQSFPRSDLLLRINLFSPGSAAVTNTNQGPNHSALAVVRNREFWHDVAGQNDVLKVKTTAPGADQAEVDVLGGLNGHYVGVHLHDDAASPAQTTLAPLPYFSAQPFQTGVDLYMPAATPPNGTVTVTNLPRGVASSPQTVALPNWPSSTDGCSVHFNDWLSS